MGRNFEAMVDGTQQILCAECGATVTSIQPAIDFNEVAWRVANAKKKCAAHVCGEPDAEGLVRITKKRLAARQAVEPTKTKADQQLKRGA